MNQPEQFSKKTNENESAAKTQDSDDKLITDEYRAELATKLKNLRSHTERREILEGAKANVPEYLIARNVSQFRRNLNIKTPDLELPERLDVLTSIVTDNISEPEKERIVKTTYKDLLFQIGQGGKEKVPGIDKYLAESLATRQKMLAGISEYLKTQEGLPRELRDHQIGALAKIKTFVESGHLRGYIAHPTGAGKTVLFSSLIKLSNARTLIVVPKKVLVKQTVQELRRFMPGKRLTYVGSIEEGELNGLAEKGEDGDVVVAIEQSLKANSHDLKREDFDLVIWDEAHNSYTSKSQESLRHFPSSIKIAFTATPDYIYTNQKPGYEEVEIDGEKLYRDPEKSAERYYPHEIDRIDLKEAIMEGMLSPVAAAVVDVNMDLEECRTGKTANGLDYNENDLNNLLKKHWPTLKKVATDSFNQGIKMENGESLDIKDKQIFAVCSTVEQAEDLAREFLANGITAKCVTGGTSNEERDEIFEDYKKRKVQVLTSVQVLKEGWDCPEAEVCLMMRPTLSRVFYQQAIGRVLRLDDNNPKKVALVVDFLGSYQTMVPMTTPTMFGVNEFYNGQIIVPPKIHGKENGGGNTKKEETENPYNVSTVMKVIQKVENIKRIDNGTIEIDGEQYLLKSKLTEDFHFREDYIGKLISEKKLSEFKLGNRIFYKLADIRRNFEEMTFSGDDLEREHSIRVLSEKFGVRDGYLRYLMHSSKQMSDIKAHTLFTSGGNPYTAYKAKDIWFVLRNEMGFSNTGQEDRIRREFENAAEAARQDKEKRENAEFEREFEALTRQEEMFMKIYNQITELADRQTYEYRGEVGKTLARIDLPDYILPVNISRLEEKLIILKNRFIRISAKTVRECDRLLEELKSIKNK